MIDRAPTPPSGSMVIVRVTAYTVIVGLALFGLSGRLDWTMAWKYLFVVTISTGVNIYFVAYKHPGLVAERTKFTKGEGILTHGSSGAELPMRPGAPDDHRVGCG